MQKPVNGSDTPAQAAKSQAVRGRTIARSPIPFQTTLAAAPLPEGISKAPAAEEAINYLFKIELTAKHSLLVLEQVGQGGMGRVYRATNEFRKAGGKTERGGNVAVKLIHFDDRQLGSDPEKSRRDFSERFFDEVQLVTKLNHDNIIKIFVYGETNEIPEKAGEAPENAGPSAKKAGMVPFYAMEFLEGKNLDEMLQATGTLSWAVLKPIMLQACSALVAAHEYEEEGVKKPIIHRDIKPANIVITTDVEGNQKVKVLDFGIAKILSPKVAETQGPEELRGTPDYMSPEQASCREMDARTDIYSLGAMMYHLLSGRVPLPFEETLEKHIQKIQNEKPAPLTWSTITVTEELERIIFKCLEKEPSKRYQSVRELKADLVKCGGIVLEPEEEKREAEPAPPERTEVSEPLLEMAVAPGPSRSGRRRLAWVFGATMLAAASGGVFVANMARRSAPNGNAQKAALVDASPKHELLEPPMSDGGAADGIAMPDTQPGKISQATDKAETAKPQRKAPKRKKPKETGKKKGKFLIDSE